MASRSTAMSGILLVLSGLATGCQSPTGVVGEMVQIGTTHVAFLGPPAAYRTLHPRLEKLFARPVVFNTQPSGQAIATQMEQGNIAFAILSAGEYGSIADPGKLNVLAVGLNALGQPKRRAHIIVRADSHVKSITDCAGKRFAFGTHGDLLTDKAAQAALEAAGVPVKKLLPELLTPPPLGLEGRLYLGHDTAKTIVYDPTVNAGVIDEVDYEKMPPDGGNLVTGPSKDQLKIVGGTIAVPETVVVAGPSADPALKQALKSYLINELKNDSKVCDQMGLRGFTEPDDRLFDDVRRILGQNKS
ncbi:MAG: phosphate/phosphite/phosphonate ABC transporter substrate-binding protein [Phycisphaerae bacterium]